MMKKYMHTLFAVCLLLLPETLSAQTDTTYLFRFVPQKEISFACEHREAITVGKNPLTVDGYCSSNHVKSELNLHNGMREESFETRNRTDALDYQDFQSSISLRFNLLRWATLTPDLGFEWRISPVWSVQLNGTWTSWSRSNKDKRYALWEISPELRYYIGKQKRAFLGAMYHIGEFNYKPGNTGKQGDLQGGGITGGYVLKLNRSLDLDLHAGLGYTHAKYDRYNVVDGIRVQQGNESKNYWGVNQLGVTLVWKLLK